MKVLVLLSRVEEVAITCGVTIHCPVAHDWCVLWYFTLGKIL